MQRLWKWFREASRARRGPGGRPVSGARLTRPRRVVQTDERLCPLTAPPGDAP